MANVKFTGLMPVASLEPTDIFALSRVSGTPISLSATSQVIANYVAQNLTLVGGDGINFTALTSTISADINTTNLKFTSNEIDTIQGISSAASPEFTGLTLSGFLSNPEGFQGANQIVDVIASQVVDVTIFGSTILSSSVGTINLTLPLGLTPPDNTEFDMIRGDSGDFNLVAAAGVNINGVDGNTISLPQEWDRAKVRYIKPNEWSAIEYSGAVGSVTNQEVYDNSPSGIISLASGKPGGWSGTDAGVVDPSQTFAQFQAIAAPAQGLHAYASDIDRSVFWDGAAYQQVAWLSDIAVIITDGAAGETYFTSNATPTIIASPATPVQIAGTFIAGINSNFTASPAGALTFNGVDSTVVNIYLTSAAYFDAGYTGLINIYVYKNGIAQPNLIEQYSIDGVSSTPKPLIVSGKLSVDTNDILTARIENVDSNQNIIVKSINFGASTIGGVGASGAEDLEDAYTLGDGTITSTAGKPLELLSSDNAIIPDFNLSQTSLPIAGQRTGRIGFRSLNSTSNNLYFGLIQNIVTNPTNNSESAEMQFLSRQVSVPGSSELYKWGSYRGESKDFNFVNKTTIGTENRTISSSLGTVQVPTTTYPNNLLTPVWQTLYGSNVVTALSFPIGSTLEISSTGTVDGHTPDVIVGNLIYLNVTFGGIININSSSIFPTNSLSAFAEGFEFTFKIIRVSQTQLAVCGSGFVGNDNRTTIPFYFPNTIWTSSYVEDSSYSIGVNIDKTLIDISGGYMNYICRGLTIKQY